MIATIDARIFHGPPGWRVGGVPEVDVHFYAVGRIRLMNVTSLSVILRAAAVVVFILATLGVAPVPMTPLGLALWCGSTVHVLGRRVGETR
jgi:hypothetical protein